MPWTASDIPSQKGRMAIVTGIGGIGYEIGLALAQAGADTVFAGRSAEKGRRAVDRVRAAVPHASIRFEMLDLASLASIAEFSERMLSARKPLDILINNAAAMNPPGRLLTADGFELHFGTNHLGHFALTLRLLPLLLMAQAPRVVSMSSSAHKPPYGTMNFDDLQAERVYRPSRAYGQSKAANVMFALELQRRAAEAGTNLVSNAAHPGLADSGSLDKTDKKKTLIMIIVRMLMPLLSHSASAGALPVLYAATSPDARGGGYYGPSGYRELKGPPVEVEMGPNAKDQAAARRLWELSEKLTGITPSFAPLA